MFVNAKTKELNLKIVYCGSPRSGKTTNLEYIHANTAPNQRGDLTSMKSIEGHAHFFDHLQMRLHAVGGLSPLFNIYTIPGQIHHRASRRMVLRGVDGLVFVADTQSHRLKATLAAFHDMCDHLEALDTPLHTLPLVVQFNKRDLSDVTSIEETRAALALEERVSHLEAIATRGLGVMETLRAILVSTINKRGVFNQHHDQHPSQYTRSTPFVDSANNTVAG